MKIAIANVPICGQEHLDETICNNLAKYCSMYHVIVTLVVKIDASLRKTLGMNGIPNLWNSTKTFFCQNFFLGFSKKKSCSTKKRLLTLKLT